MTSMTYSEIKASGLSAAALRAKADALAAVPPQGAWAVVSAHWFAVDRLRVCADRLDRGEVL